MMTEQAMLNEAADKVDELLKERQIPNPKTEAIVINSHEKAKIERNNSADCNSLSQSKKEQKLDRFLRERRGHGKRRRRKITLSDVRAETANILEEFLKPQLQEQSVQTKSPEKYQRYVEVNVTEETTPSGSSTGYLASNSNLLREDSIPYADDSDYELRKTGSLPHDDFFEGVKGLEIHHGKSKSAPYPNVVENEGDYIDYKPQKRPVPRSPPPPPPGTPHSQSDEGSEGKDFSSVPYVGKHTDSSILYSTDSLSMDHNHSPQRRPSPPKRLTPPKAPNTLDLPRYDHKQHVAKSHNGSATKFSSPDSGKINTHGYRKQRISASTTETDSEGGSDPYMHGRKKKSVFKKTKERLQTLLRLRGKSHSAYDEDFSENLDNREDVIKKRFKNKKQKSKKQKEAMNGDLDEADMLEPEVLEDRHIHRSTHIHQSHIKGGQGLMREEDCTEVIDIMSDSEKKHIEKHSKVKESSGNGRGIMGRIKRMTLKDKGKQRSMKGSKSQEVALSGKGKAADSASDDIRVISVPGHHRHRDTGFDFADDAGCPLQIDGKGGYSVTSMERLRPTGSREEIHATQVVSRADDIKRHSSHLDILDHSGTMLERLYFDLDEDNNFPRNKSFDFNQEEYVHEKRVRGGDGRVKVIRDGETHDHIEISEDGDTEDTPQFKDLSEADKDDLYGKIAGRLAEIGDNLMTEKEQEHSRRSSSASPRGKVVQSSGEKEISPDEEIKKTVLSKLEMEIRDELRNFADDLDARLARDARQAAMHIAGVVTYSHFKNVVQESVGNEVGWAQVAAVFNITKRAIKMAGAGGALAVQIKEMSLKYIEDKFANWIVGQGGWDSMLSDQDTDSELD